MSETSRAGCQEGKTEALRQQLKLSSTGRISSLKEVSTLPFGPFNWSSQAHTGNVGSSQLITSMKYSHSTTSISDEWIARNCSPAKLTHHLGNKQVCQWHKSGYAVAKKQKKALDL